MKSAAYFDVDGTLVRTNLIQPTIHFFGNQSSLMGSIRKIGTAILDGPRMLHAEMRDRRMFNEILYSHYRGISEDRLKVLAREIFEDILIDAVFPGAKDLISLCKKADQRVVLVTGSLDVTIRYLADYLGADDWIANRLELKDGIATGKLMHPVVAGPVKSHLIVEDAKKHGYDLSECHAYSDSYSDVPMLSVVGQAFCVNPDKKLTRLAQAYRWPIIDITRKTPGSNPDSSRS
ncbi:MAG: HAD family phosphatase [Myxococcota bacterium]|nr:HAD family phosphatase [Myxococcota bacterium]